jgi:hypothetical protein
MLYKMYKEKNSVNWTRFSTTLRSSK